MCDMKASQQKEANLRQVVPVVTDLLVLADQLQLSLVDHEAVLCQMAPLLQFSSSQAHCCMHDVHFLPTTNTTNQIFHVTPAALYTGSIVTDNQIIVT